MNESLFSILQNSVLSAISLHSFVLGFHNITKNKDYAIKYPRLEYVFYVLPIVYHYDSMVTFKSSNELYTALTKNSSIILGLQERANKLSKQTFDGLNLAFSKKILDYNKYSKTVELMPFYKTKKLTLFLSMNTSENIVKSIQDSAFKLGFIFAKRDPQIIQYELNIRF